MLKESSVSKKTTPNELQVLMEYM